MSADANKLQTVFACENGEITVILYYGYTKLKT